MNQHDVIVIGAGQAGLAIGYHLARHGREFLILEAAGRPAAAWRERWDSLRLFTPVRYDSLPGLPFPGDPGHHPTRDEVVAYLTDYARRFQLPIEYDSHVRALRRDDDGYVVDLGARRYRAGQVVVATGPFQVPRVPAAAERLDPAVVQLHSSDYRVPADIPEGPMLVVGGGNTGYQIAEELAATREVHLSVGSRQMPLPQRALGRDVFTWLTAAGLMGKTTDSRIGRRMRDRETLIGSSPRSARRRGIRLHGRTIEAEGRTVTFDGGATLDVAAVVWATGFGLDHSWIDAPVFAPDGAVAHRRGITAAPGLCFLGLPWQHTRGSALIGWVKDDAQYLAEQIEAHQAPELERHSTPMPAVVAPQPAA